LEAAKQAPALCALIWLVIHLSGRSEERMRQIIDAQQSIIKSLEATIAANNMVLGSVQTLFQLVAEDLKSGNRRRSS
jgi:hypothetical protein